MPDPAQDIGAYSEAGDSDSITNKQLPLVTGHWSVLIIRSSLFNSILTSSALLESYDFSIMQDIDIIRAIIICHSVACFPKGTQR